MDPQAHKPELVPPPRFDKLGSQSSPVSSPVAEAESSPSLRDSTRPARAATATPPSSGFLAIFDPRKEVADWEKFKLKCTEAYGASASELEAVRFLFDPRTEGYVARNLWLKLREAFPVLASAAAQQSVGGGGSAWRLGELATLLAPPAQPAFHAWVGRDDAAALLLGRPLGTYLWRFGTAGHLSLAVVCPPGPSSSHSSADGSASSSVSPAGHVVRHWRIVVKGRHRLLFTTSTSQQRVFRNLVEIEDHYKREPLVIAPGYSVLLTQALPRLQLMPAPSDGGHERSSSLSSSSSAISVGSSGSGSQTGSNSGSMIGSRPPWAWPHETGSPGSAGSPHSPLSLAAPPPSNLRVSAGMPPPPPAVDVVRGERAQSSPPAQLLVRPLEPERATPPLGAAGVLLGAGYQRRLPSGAPAPTMAGLTTQSASPPWSLLRVPPPPARDAYRTSLPPSLSLSPSPAAAASLSDAGGRERSGTGGSASASTDGAEQYKEIDYAELVIRYPPVGGGAFGMVYRGSWRGADVAVKQLHAADLDLDELRREARVWQRLAHHPNVAHLVGACTRQYPFCLVSDYYTKGSLYDILIKRREAVEWHHVVHVLMTAAVGIAHLHKEQVIHRDVSARNILVQVVDDQWIAKVSDFGLARVKSSAAAAHSRSGGGAIKWMSPELLLEHRYSEHSDAYSFGITLWECVYRSEPYPDVAPALLALQVCQPEQPLRPSLDERCPVAIQDLMRLCWAAEPDARPPFHDIHERLRIYYDSLRLLVS